MGGCFSAQKKKQHEASSPKQQPSPSTSQLKASENGFSPLPRNPDKPVQVLEHHPPQQEPELEKLIEHDEAPPRCPRRGVPLLSFVMLLFVGVILGAGLGWSARQLNAQANRQDLRAVVDAGEEHTTQLGLCGTSSGFDWQAVSGVDPIVERAIGHGLELLNFARRDCEGGGYGPLQYTLSDFKEGGAGETSYIHVHHKFAANCEGEAYKLHYYTTGAARGEAEHADTSFVIEVFRDFESDAWHLLRSNPPACTISLEGIAYPEPHETTSKFVQEQAQFAVSELSYQMRLKGCLGVSASLEVDKVLSARSQIQAGLRLTLRLALKEAGTAMEPKHVELIVLEKCDLTMAGVCVNELSLPSLYPDVCAPIDLETPIMLRRLSDPDHKRIGSSPVDATEAHLVRRRLLDPRVLSGSEKKPLKLRHIKDGAVPDHHDPRSDDCFRRITVYDQGQCGSSYATAAAQMMGIRKCLFDAKQESARRLMKRNVSSGFLTKDAVSNGSSSNASESKAPVPVKGPSAADKSKPRLTVHGDKCLKEWQWSGFECKDYCCNPDNSPKAWCMREDLLKDPWWSFCESQEPRLCNDNMAWSDSFGRTCPWYTEHEGSCTDQPDYGQLTHCQYTCRTCDDEDKDSSPDGPWYNARYEYMPSAMDLAQCTFVDENRTQLAGCDGGRFDWMWDNWLRKETRDLHVMGDKCMAYKLKCWESRNVVHSLMGSYCSLYEGYQLWHKPCACIDQKEWPSSMTCSNEAPDSSCSFGIPPMAVDVMHVGHGLSNHEAVQNMQRHIVEYGPLFVTFDIADDFFSWNWDENPVYTGKGNPSDGMHAVVLCGWGEYAGKDYWLLRNSWSSDWGDRGYFKLQRGVNLYNIEGDSIVATLPEEVDSHIPPYCRLMSWRREPIMNETTFVLTSFTLEVTLECDEDVDLAIEASYRDDLERVKQYKAQATAGQPVVAKVDLLCLGFGLLDGSLMLSWEGKDKDGQSRSIKEILLVNPVLHAKRAVDCSAA